MTTDANLRLAEAVFDLDVATKGVVKAIVITLGSTPDGADPIVPLDGLKNMMELLLMLNLLLKSIYNENCEIHDRLECFVEKYDK